jgi:septal ring factor EnvC (AmiA/AmiB activator)
MTEETAKWLFNNGLAVAIVFGIAFYARAASNAFFTAVILPLKDAAIAHLQSTTQHLDATNKTLVKTGETMDRISNELRDCRTDIAHIKTQTDRCKVGINER